MLSIEASYGIMFGATALGLLYALLNAFLVSKVQLEESDEHSKLTEDSNKIQTMKEIGILISDGARAFLIQEYKYLGVFVGVFALIIFFAVDFKSNANSDNSWFVYTTVSFLLGATTSVVSGYIGMMIATYANTRTAYNCTKSLALGFQVAYRSGCVMGFSLVSLGLLVLLVLILIYRAVYFTGSNSAYDADGNF